LTWRRELFVWEMELLQNLMCLLDGFVLQDGMDELGCGGRKMGEDLR